MHTFGLVLESGLCFMFPESIGVAENWRDADFSVPIAFCELV